jgi:hypothetical protein
VPQIPLRFLEVFQHGGEIMAFLDFIKNREGQRPAAEQQSQQQKPENAKEWHTRKDAQDKAALKPLDSIPADKQVRVDAVRAELQKSTQHQEKAAPTPAPAPADATASPQPMQQKMMSQDKPAPDLSPTSAQKGTKAMDQEAPATSGQGQSKTQEKSADQAKTIARRPPSWER